MLILEKPISGFDHSHSKISNPAIICFLSIYTPGPGRAIRIIPCMPSSESASASNGLSRALSHLPLTCSPITFLRPPHHDDDTSLVLQYLLKGVDIFSMDPNPGVAVYGSSNRHEVDVLQQIGTYTAPGSFDLAVVNGVLG